MAELQKLTYTIQEAVAASGLSRSALYVLLSEQKLKAVKSRSRTLIIAESLNAFITGLPPATFRSPATIMATDKAA